MSTATIKILDKVAKKAGDVSDYRLAIILGVTKQAISAYRHGRAHMSDAVVMTAAGVLGEHPAILLAMVKADQTPNESAKQTWSLVAKTFRQIVRTGVPAVLLATAATTGDSTAHASIAISKQDAINKYYVK